MNIILHRKDFSIYILFFSVVSILLQSIFEQYKAMAMFGNQARLAKSRLAEPHLSVKLISGILKKEKKKEKEKEKLHFHPLGWSE